MERVAGVVDRFCSFPVVEREKLFRRVLVAFLVGNEDMHAKNFSLITDGNVVRLSPVYDFVNSTIVLPRALEQMALPLSGKKANIRRTDLIDYYGRRRLALTDAAVEHVLDEIAAALPEWRTLIDASFLSPEMRDRYRALIEERVDVLSI